MTVVPIPDVPGSATERSQTRRFASSMTASRLPSSVTEPRRPSAQRPRCPLRPRRRARRPCRPRWRRAAARRRKRPRSASGVARVGDGCRAADPHACTCSSVAPILMTSPTFATRPFFSFEPLTNVPFVEPRSSTHAPFGRGSIRAWLTGCEFVAVEPDPALRVAPHDGRRRHLDRRSLLQLGARDDEESRRRKSVFGAQARQLRPLRGRCSPAAPDPSPSSPSGPRAR